MKKKVIALLVLMALATPILVACASGESVQDAPPHPSWKERGEYCWYVKVDPRGDGNSMIGWTDTEPVLEVTEAGFVVRAQNVRVAKYSRGRYSGDDYFKPSVLWATDGDGYVRIESCR